jgi:hypothetical protein
VEELLKYSKEDVDNKTINDLHVRSSSEKEPIDMNKDTIALFLYEEDVYFWCKGKKKPKKVNLDYTVRGFKFERLDDNNLILFTEFTNNENELTFGLTQIMIEFSNFSTKYVY